MIQVEVFRITTGLVVAVSCLVVFGCSGSKPKEAGPKDAGPKDAGPKDVGERPAHPGDAGPKAEAGRGPKPKAATPTDEFRRLLDPDGMPLGLSSLARGAGPAALAALGRTPSRSRLHPSIWTETLPPPLLSATYLFDRIGLVEARVALSDALRAHPDALAEALRAHLDSKGVEARVGDIRELRWERPGGIIALRLAPPESAGLLIWRPAQKAPTRNPFDSNTLPLPSAN